MEIFKDHTIRKTIAEKTGRTINVRIPKKIWENISWMINESGSLVSRQDVSFDCLVIYK